MHHFIQVFTISGVTINNILMSLLYIVYSEAGDEWSTSEIPLDQCQEKLRIRRKETLEGIHTHTFLYCTSTRI